MSKQTDELTFEEVRWKLAGLEMDCSVCHNVPTLGWDLDHPGQPLGGRELDPSCGYTGKVKRLPMLSQPCPGEPNLKSWSAKPSMVVGATCIAGYLCSPGIGTSTRPHELCHGTGYIPTSPDLSLYLEVLETLGVASIVISRIDRGFTILPIKRGAILNLEYPEGLGKTREEAAARLVLKVAEASMERPKP